MPKRLSIVSDEDPMFPVQAFFNAISNDHFVFTISNLLQGVGAGFDVAYCEFPEDLDPSDESFEGVRFSLYEDEIIVDYQTFMQYLKLACKQYIKEHPEDHNKLEQLLQAA
jgi:CDI immunity protein